MKSKSFIPLLSREGLKGFTDLNEHSRCDNVLLEYRMAQELRSAGFIEKIFPLMIGDRVDIMIDNNQYYSYNDYLQNGCHPTMTPMCSVLSVENKLRTHFDNTALGAPLLSERSVNNILSDIMSNQGGFIKGNLLSSLLTSQINLRTQNKDDSIEIGNVINDNNKNENENEIDAFTMAVDSIMKMLQINDNNKMTQNGDSIQNNGGGINLDNMIDGDFDVFDILSPGIFRRNGNTGGGLGRVKVSKKDQIEAIEKQIEYLNSMLTDLNDDDYYDLDG